MTSTVLVAAEAGDHLATDFSGVNLFTLSELMGTAQVGVPLFFAHVTLQVTILVTAIDKIADLPNSVSFHVSQNVNIQLPSPIRRLTAET